MKTEDLFESLNDAITAERLQTFGRNVKKNLPLIRQWGGLGTVPPLLRGKRIFITGAGPSMEKDILLLKKYQLRREIVIIAADMALKPLLAYGIRPAFVISCETIPAAFFSGVDTSDMHLLAFSCMSPVNLRSWKGRISFYNWLIHRPGFDELWETAGLDLGFAATASIVITQAVSIALGCGPERLVLIGNDLGFRYGFYARQSRPCTESLNSASRLKPLASAEAQRARRARQYEIRRDGEVFFTTRQFLAAKLWLERLFKEQACPVYDCSLPGCSGTSVIKTNLKSAFSDFESRSRKR